MSQRMGKTAKSGAASAAGKKAKTPAGPALDGVPIQPGDAVQIEWHGSWWPGQVLAIEPSGLVRIHYSGYDNSWDESVPLTRLRRGQGGGDEDGDENDDGASSGQGSSGAPITNPGPTEKDPFLAALANRPVTEKTKLKPGDALRVEWGGNWWAGEVVHLADNGQVRIHYTGWDKSWDETVPRSRLALPPTEVPDVSILFDNGQTLTGTVAGNAGEFLVVIRREDSARVLVNRQRILYLTPDAME